MTRTTGYNSRFAKAGLRCFYDSEVQYSSFVLLINFSAENPRLRKATNRWARLKPSPNRAFAKVASPHSPTHVATFAKSPVICHFRTTQKNIRQFNKPDEYAKKKIHKRHIDRITSNPYDTDTFGRLW
jgi:hypothetical protein